MLPTYIVPLISFTYCVRLSLVQYIELFLFVIWIANYFCSVLITCMYNIKHIIFIQHDLLFGVKSFTPSPIYSLSVLVILNEPIKMCKYTDNLSMLAYVMCDGLTKSNRIAKYILFSNESFYYDILG